MPLAVTKAAPSAIWPPGRNSTILRNTIPAPAAISDTEAHVTHDLLVIRVADVPQIMATGRYDKSVVVKTSKGWKFKSRTLKVDEGFFKLMEQWKQNNTSSTK
jgi:hypothetical protein